MARIIGKKEVMDDQVVEVDGPAITSCGRRRQTSL